MDRPRFRYLTGMTAAATVLATVLFGTAADASPARQTSDSTWNICAEATARQERAGGLPALLLTAISRAESGRWHDERGANLAWPWTVTAGGEGRYYASKRQAIDEVRRLQARGVRNIDVGCMQINLYYHPDAFAGLEQAFDPATNAAYAARFLSDLRDRTGSWEQAAAHYHSSDPTRNRRYLDKVVRLWDMARDTAVTTDDGQPAGTEPEKTETAKATPGDDETAPAYTIVPIDRERTRLLNARLRETRAGGRATGQGAWANGRDLGLWQAAESGRSGAEAPSFAEKRRAQLKAWRQGAANPFRR